jgi:uncharacterized membrane protein
MSTSGLIFLLAWGLLIVLILLLLWHPQRSRSQTDSIVERQRPDPMFRDDDRYWYAGFFYNNPDDPALFVPKRFGLGWTLNFGHPQARWIILGMLLIFLVCGVILPVLFSGMAPTGCHTFGCTP